MHHPGNRTGVSCGWEPGRPDPGFGARATPGPPSSRAGAV